MERHHRDLLAAIVGILGCLLALLGWGAASRMREGPPVAIAHSPAATAAPAGRAAPDAPLPASGNKPAPPAARPAAIRIHIVGAVRNSAVYALPRDARVIDAVHQAGGTTPDADVERINLADFLQDGEQVRIPRKSERRRPPAVVASVPSSRSGRTAVPAASSAPVSRVAPYRSAARYPLDEPKAPASGSLDTSAAAPPPAATPTPGGKVNLNNATAAELDTLPGVGPATAAAILDYRRQHRFLRIEDIMEVRGIGEKKFAAMKDRLTVK